MLVVRKVVNKITVNGIKNEFFQGILCRWFTTSGEIQEAVFSTKDIQKI